MKVRDEMIHGAKAIRGPDEDTRLAAAGGDIAICVDGTLERTDSCRADSPDRTSVLARRCDRRCRLRRYHVSLLVHHMFTGILDFDRLEGPRPDVKNDLGAPNAAPNEGLQKLRSEMKTGGGRPDPSRLPSVDGVIPRRLHTRRRA